MHQQTLPPPQHDRLFRLGVVSLALGLTLLLLLLTLLTLLGFVPGLSSLTGSAQPRDLGVRYDGRVTKAAQSKVTPAPGARLLDTALTEAEVTALANEQAALRADSLRQIQVRLKPGGAFEVSALTELGGREVPFYGRGRATFSDGRLVERELAEARVGILPLPSSLRRQVEQTLVDLLEGGLRASPDFTLQSLETDRGMVRMRGEVQPPS